MGGRGATSGGWTGGAGGVANIISTTDLISERERKQVEVDETLQAFQDVYDKYGYQVEQIQIATMGASDAGVMAYYDGSNIAINQTYFNKANMDSAYDACVKSGYHPPQGNKTALQAVASHELGHALTDEVSAKIGRDGATAILNEATKNAGYKKASTMAGAISGYAKTSPKECIAEAFSDVYCNGNNAHKESIAIVNVIDKYLKKQEANIMANKKVKYVEPKGYFPEEIRKKYGIGEYAKTTPKEKDTKNSTKPLKGKK